MTPKPTPHYWVVHMLRFDKQNRCGNNKEWHHCEAIVTTVTIPFLRGQPRSFSNLHSALLLFCMSLKDMTVYAHDAMRCDVLSVSYAHQANILGILQKVFIEV